MRNPGGSTSLRRRPLQTSFNLLNGDGDVTQTLGPSFFASDRFSFVNSSGETIGVDGTTTAEFDILFGENLSFRIGLASA